MNFHEIAKAPNGKRSGDGYVARCPAHEDRTPSLSISSSGEKVLFYCHAGCTQENVISALNELGLWKIKVGQSLKFNRP